MLSAPSRLRLLYALRDGEAGVGELAELAGLTPSAASQQLRILRHLRLVATRREGRSILYRLHDGHVASCSTRCATTSTTPRGAGRLLLPALGLRSEPRHAHAHPHTAATGTATVWSTPRSSARAGAGRRRLVAARARAHGARPDRCFVASGSVALLADLIHNFGDAATAFPLAIAFALRSARAERWAGLAVVLAIFVSACVAGYESIAAADRPARARAPGGAGRRRRARVRRQLAGRRHPHPSRPATRQRRAGRRRRARPRRRLCEPRRGGERGRRRARVRHRGSADRARDHAS